MRSVGTPGEEKNVFKIEIFIRVLTPARSKHFHTSTFFTFPHLHYRKSKVFRQYIFYHSTIAVLYVVRLICPCCAAIQQTILWEEILHVAFLVQYLYGVS